MCIRDREHQGTAIGILNQHGDVFYKEPQDTLQHQRVYFVSELTSWIGVLRRMQSNMDDIVIVTSRPFTQTAGHVVGIITQREVAKSARQTVELI